MFYKRMTLPTFSNSQCFITYLDWYPANSNQNPLKELVFSIHILKRLPTNHFHSFNSHHLQLLYQKCDFKFVFSLNYLMIKNINLKLSCQDLVAGQQEILIFYKYLSNSNKPMYCWFTFISKIFYK